MVDGDDWRDGELTLEERISHIRYTLADICCRRNVESFSFYRILNRASLLLQEPVCFAVVQSDQAGTVYRRDRDTVLDPLYKAEFQRGLEQVGYQADGQLSPEIVAPFLIQLFGTSYYILAFQVKADADAPFSKQRVRYLPIRSDSDVGEVLVRIFDRFGQALRNVGFEKNLQESFDELFGRSRLLTALMDDPTKYPALPDDLETIKKFELKFGKLSLADILENILRDIIRSPILSPKSGRVPNLLISRKVFNRADLRFSSYRYSIELFMTDEQKDAFSDNLTDADRDRFIAFPHRQVDAWFWRSVKDGQAGELLQNLDAPQSAGARLFPEYTLTSGAAILNRNPFARGDIGWLAAVPAEEREIELRRFCVLHYMLQLMYADDPRRGQPALLTLPIRVSGATWMAATLVVDGGSDAMHRDITSSDEFQRRFLAYHSLMRDFETKLRRQSKQVYIKSIFNIFSDVVSARDFDTNGSRNSGKPVKLLDSDYVTLSSRLTALCRLYPYDPVHLAPSGAFEGLQGLEWEPLGEACDIDIGMYRQSPFFDRLQLRSFLTMEAVCFQMRSLVNAEIGLQHWKRSKLRMVS